MEIKPEQVDSSHAEIREYDPNWMEMYEQESQKIKEILEDKIIKIEHIGSSSVPGLASKPIIDMAIEVLSWKDADMLIEPLETLGYTFNKAEHEGTERHLLRKGNPTQFHLSICYADRGSFLERQILFRDYLRAHDEERNAYADLKRLLMKQDPTGKGEYLSGKTDFVMRTLKKSGFQNRWFDLSKY